MNRALRNPNITLIGDRVWLFEDDNSQIGGIYDAITIDLQRFRKMSQWLEAAYQEREKFEDRGKV